jgi:uncharacterized protein (DUF169 family)
MEKTTNAQYSALLKETLGLKWSPIAVKLVKTDEATDNIPPNSEKRLRYCQLLMEAKKGKSATLTAENIACPAAAAALGLLPYPEKIRSGGMLKTLGLFESEEPAAQTIAQMPGVEIGQIKAIAAAPFEDAKFKPDVIVIEDIPEKIMWINLAAIHQTGGRLTFSSAVFQATCVDVTAIPYLSKKVNVSLGCYGCRDATDIAENEVLVGIPIEKLDEITKSLKTLSQKAMPEARSKGVYNQFMKAQHKQVTQ